MKLEAFKRSLSEEEPSPGLPVYLRALWYDAKGDWERAHALIQDIADSDGSWIHAYLHRKEGDAGNAAYWYNRAHKKMPSTSLEAEWESLAEHFLNQP